MLVKNLFFKKGTENCNVSTLIGRPRTDKNKDKKLDRGFNRMEKVNENSCLNKITEERIRALYQFQINDSDLTCGRRRTANPVIQTQAKAKNLTSVQSYSRGSRNIKHKIRRRSMFSSGKAAEIEQDRRQRRMADSKFRKKEEKSRILRVGRKIQTLRLLYAHRNAW